MVGGTAAGDFTDHPEHLHFSKNPGEMLAGIFIGVILKNVKCSG